VGGLAPCAHGFYLMPSCPMFSGCHCGWTDHINLWAGPGIDGRPEAFLLSAPYADELSPEATAYASAHGLRLDVNRPGDNWYGHRTLPIRMSLDEQVLWPIEPMITTLLATQPVAWPDEEA